MKNTELKMIEFLPQYMRTEKSVQGIAYAIDKEFGKIIENVANCFLIGRIDQLGDTLLDELAWQFNIPEYSSGLDIVVKRELLKTCIQTHRHRGTVAAVEKVITDIFGNGYVEEWFDYDTIGDPFKFKIHTSNVSVSDTMVAEFERAVKATQNLRSLLEQVIIETSQDMDINFGNFMTISENVYLSE